MFQTKQQYHRELNSSPQHKSNESQVKVIIHENLQEIVPPAAQTGRLHSTEMERIYIKIITFFNSFFSTAHGRKMRNTKAKSKCKKHPSFPSHDVLAKNVNAHQNFQVLIIFLSRCNRSPLHITRSITDYHHIHLFPCPDKKGPHSAVVHMRCPSQS